MEKNQKRRADQNAAARKEPHMEQIYFVKGYFSEITTVHCSKCVLKVSVFVIISHGFFVTTRLLLQWTGALFSPDTVGSF